MKKERIINEGYNIPIECDKMSKKYIRVKSHTRKINGKEIHVKAYLRKRGDI